MNNNKDYIKQKAQDFRDECRLSSTEPIRVKSLLQKLDIIAIYKPLSETFSGMAMKIEIRGKIKMFMLINSEHSIGKQHFTICHELYHLFIQENFKASRHHNIGTFDKKDGEEYNADVFASHLLLPEQGIRGMIPEEEQGKNKISIKTILAIEQYYASSHTALLSTLVNIGEIDKTKKESLTKGIKTNARRYGYDISLYEQGNEGVVIGDYGVKSYEAWDKGIVSESMYMQLLSDIGVDTTKVYNDGGDDGQ